MQVNLVFLIVCIFYYFVLEYYNHSYINEFGLWNKSSQFLVFYKKICFDIQVLWITSMFLEQLLCTQTKVLVYFFLGNFIKFHGLQCYLCKTPQLYSNLSLVEPLDPKCIRDTRVIAGAL